MFKRRDIPPVLLLLLLIILVMLTLSQILVVHNGRYGRNVHNMRKLQLELREMDINLHSLMMQNVPSIELNRRLLQNEINAGRIAAIIAKASETHQALPDRTRGHGRPTVPTINYKLGAALPKHWSDQQQSPKTHIQKWNISLVPNIWTNVINKTYGSNASNSLSPQSLSRTRNINTSIPTFTPSSPSSINVSGASHRPRKTTLVNESSPRLTMGERTASFGRPSGTNARPAGVALSSRRGEVSLGGRLRHIPAQRRPPALLYCPSIPPLLKGRVFVNFEHKHNFTEAEIVSQNPYLQPGGMSRPSTCVARHRVAVIVPYRDRWTHLMILLSHLHPILQRQQLDYTIYVVEQSGRDTFNKARIMNIAFVEALKQNNFQCFVFHDVDLVPEDDRNMYSCPTQPRHMSVAIDEMGYKLAYQELVGGVLNMRTEHFQRVNGYSNLYWGWGAEDDDMAYRIMHVGLKITRPPEGVARYKMVKHTKRKPADWRKRAKLLYTGTRRFQFDGLNSLQYKVVHVKRMPLFTHVLVDIGKPPRGF